MENKKINTTVYCPFVVSTVTYPNVRIKWETSKCCSTS